LKKAFTLIEIVVALTITAIILGSTFQLFTNIYKSYKYAKDISDLDKEITNVLMILVKYLENRVEGSEINISRHSFSILSDLHEFNLTTQNSSFQWISYDFDGYLGIYRNNQNKTLSLYSGVLDLSIQNKNNIMYLDQSSETDLNTSKEMVLLETNNLVDITNCKINNNCPAIFFKWRSANDKDGFGWKCSIENNFTVQTCADNNYSINVFIGEMNDTGSRVQFHSALADFSIGHPEQKFYEHYVFSYTAMGLKIENGSLYLYKNYRPWNGDSMELSTSTKTLLLKNVKELSFKSNGSLIEIKLCSANDLKNNDEIYFCRENIVY
jgi:prepilin-type N-terminal cleavage/methylation domain-containing protein